MTASNVRKMVTRAGVQAKFAFPVHPHMLRHACGFKLANEGHDTRSLQHYLVTRTSLIPFGIPTWRPIDLRDSGRTS